MHASAQSEADPCKTPPPELSGFEFSLKKKSGRSNALANQSQTILSSSVSDGHDAYDQQKKINSRLIIFGKIF